MKATTCQHCSIEFRTTDPEPADTVPTHDERLWKLVPFGRYVPRRGGPCPGAGQPTRWTEEELTPMSGNTGFSTTDEEAS